ERVFAVKEDTYIETIHWRLRAIGEIIKSKMIEVPLASEDPSRALTGKRRVYLGPEVGEIEASIYRGEKLQPGNKILPPSIIEEPTTTLAVLPGSKVTVTKYGNYFIEMS
ncbi:unnamed protein product, partial [marine sediment metagenome]